MKTLKRNLIIAITSVFVLSALALTKTNNLSITINSFDEVNIGTQTWAKQNLNVAHFKNGDKIKQVTSSTEWMMAGINKEPAWCYFEFNSENEKKYGKLYNGYAVFDKRGLAPKGWKIASDQDWKKLEAFISKNANRLKKDNSNETGFSAVYSGSINSSGSFMPEFFMSWTSTKNSNKAFYRRVNNYNIGIDRKLASLNAGFAVRCLKN